MSRPAAALLGAAVALALPAAASANDFQTVYKDYKRGGAIKPCKYSDQQLANAERQTPPDVEQYAPSFLDALAAARERNADCGKQAAATPPPAQTPPTASTPQPVASQPAPAPATPAPATGQPPAPTVPVQPAVAGVPSPPVDSTKRRDSAPAALWILAGVGVLALLAALWALLAWWFGWTADRFSRPLRASAADFGGRVADRRMEFADWVRTGH